MSDEHDGLRINLRKPGETTGRADSPIADPVTVSLIKGSTTSAAPHAPEISMVSGTREESPGEPLGPSHPTRGVWKLGAAVAALAALVVVAVLAFQSMGSSRSSAVAVNTASASPGNESNPGGGTQALDGVQAPPTSSNAGPSSSEPSATESASPAVTTAGQALAALSSQRNQDLKQVKLNGLWAAQLASQYVGVVDTAIQPGPMDALDIWNYSQSLAHEDRFAGDRMIVLKQNDFGQLSSDTRPIWITLDLLQMPTPDAVQSWCATTFHLSGNALAEHCIPRRMVPAHP